VPIVWSVFPALTTHDAAAVVFAHPRDGVLVSRDGGLGW
jgi:hypothetical protein